MLGNVYYKGVYGVGQIRAVVRLGWICKKQYMCSFD